MIAFKIDLSDLNKEINKVKNVRKKEEYKHLLDNILYDIAKDVKKSISKKFIKRNDYPYSPTVKSLKSPVKIRMPKSFSVPFIGKRTGKLEKSIKIVGGRYLTEQTTKGIAYKGKKARMSYFVTFDDSIAPYTGIQEEGGRIEPRRRRYLTIPINKESWGKSPLVFKNTVVARNIIFKKIRKGLYKPLYLLVKSVEIEGSHFIEYTVKEFNLDKYIKRFKFNIENIL